MPTPRPEPTPNLWQRAVLIGTPESVVRLEHDLAAAGRPFAGCFLTSRPQDDVPAGHQFGLIDALPAAHEARPFTLAVVSLPRAMSATIAKVRTLLRAKGIAERFVPTIEDLLDGTPRPATPNLNDIDPVELIGRTPYGIDRKAVAAILENRRVLITGAGGSIGSEIARICATFRPSQLILMERSENALFEIDRQIAQRFPGIQRKALLHDVVDSDQTLRHLVALKPDVVFHAAAHKHVPLMEDHPAHAVTNNLFGTKSIADAALATGVDRFVMISSDKAVNPTSIMGATKRLAEMYVQSLHAARSGRTSFSMVRFGNVLGSACSVLPIWSNQIAEGGPVTVTDPRMTRYFMTIHEAATLVIQSAAIDTRQRDAASVYVLDMGEPIRILDMARRFVRMCGFAPAIEGEPVSPADATTPTMPIALTGARPGEKLYEELAYAAEALNPTPFPGINAWAGTLHADFDAAAMIAELSVARAFPDREPIVRAIRRLVPEMRVADHGVRDQTETKLVVQDRSVAA